MLGNRILAVGAVIAGFMLPSQAMAQYDAQTGADLNLRVGPGTEYGIIEVIPAGYPVDVLGCLDAYEWCDIEWDGLRGWVFARYLVQPGTTIYLPQYAPRIGVPIISFSFGTYHDRYYRDRPWYRERHGRWRGRDYRDVREERAEDRDDRRRETREEIRDERRDTREEIRDERRDNREEVQEERRETRQERQERLRQQQEAEQPQQQRRQPQQSRQQRQQQEAAQPRQRQRQQQQEAAQPRQRQQAEQPRQGEQTERQRRRERERQGQSIRQPE